MTDEQKPPKRIFYINERSGHGITDYNHPNEDDKNTDVFDIEVTAPTKLNKDTLKQYIDELKPEFDKATDKKRVSIMLKGFIPKSSWYRTGIYKDNKFWNDVIRQFAPDIDRLFVNTEYFDELDEDNCKNLKNIDFLEISGHDLIKKICPSPSSPLKAKSTHINASHIYDGILENLQSKYILLSDIRWIEDRPSERYNYNKEEEECISNINKIPEGTEGFSTFCNSISENIIMPESIKRIHCDKKGCKKMIVKIPNKIKENILEISAYGERDELETIDFSEFPNITYASTSNIFDLKGLKLETFIRSISDDDSSIREYWSLFQKSNYWHDEELRGIFEELEVFEDEIKHQRWECKSWNTEPNIEACTKLQKSIEKNKKLILDEGRYRDLTNEEIFNLYNTIDETDLTYITQRNQEMKSSRNKHFIEPLIKMLMKRSSIVNKEGYNIIL